MELAQAHTIEDLRTIARRRLPRFVFDFIDGGSEREVSMRANRESLERLRFRPRILVNVSDRDLKTSILGLPSDLPVIVGPLGLLGLSWPHGDLETARAAAQAKVPFAVSTVSMDSLEDIADRGQDRLWFQCYVFSDRRMTERLIKRAAAAGYKALIITADFPVVGKRVRDLRSGMLPEGRLALRSWADMLTHLPWFVTVGLRRPRFVNVEQELEPGKDANKFVANDMFDPSLDWDAFRYFRDIWKGKLLLKGVLRADDAIRAFDSGADGVILSNHGGRQLDGAVSGMAALPDVVEATRGRGSIIVDGGVRHGSDIAKALACGAEAVILGRAINYGLAAGGAAGVGRALEIMRDEFDRTLALNGCCCPGELSTDLITTV